MHKIALADLNAMPEADFAAALAELFEHAPWVARQAAARRPFATVQALLDALTDAVQRAPEAEQMALIRNHPDLAGKAARRGTVTADSRTEQASAGLDRLADADYETFDRLNAAYRERFAMPFIVAVRRHGKDSILRQMQKRLGNLPAAERATALAEIVRIAALRVDQRVAGPDRLLVHGRLSTHVLDAYHGRPAAGVALSLVEIAASGETSLLTRATTNADGRTDAPLIADRPIPIGTYELRFDVGAYFANAAVPLADPPFLGEVPVRFSVAEPEGHYHVPLLVTPWSYSTYRGS